MPRTPRAFKTTWQRTTLLVLAITLHNIPEGLAVGVAFGAVAAGLTGGDAGRGASPWRSASACRIFPRGSLSPCRCGARACRALRAFWYGQLSALVEPIAGVVGAAVVLQREPLLPYALAFAAGAMIFVVVEEVMPEAQSGGNTDLATIGTMIGFAPDDGAGRGAGVERRLTKGKR